MYILNTSQKRIGVTVLILSVFGAIAELLGVSVILPLIQSMLNPDTLVDNSFISSLLRVFDLKSQNIFILILILTIFVYLLKNFYLCILSWVRIKYSNKIQREISIKMVHSYVERGYPFFKNTNSSVLLRGCRDAVFGMQEVVYCFFKILSEIILLLAIFIYAFYIDSLMAFTTIAVAIICMLLIVSVFRKIVQISGKTYHEKLAKNNQWLLQLFNGIKEAMVMNKEDYFVDKYEETYIQQQKAQIVQTMGSETPIYIVEGLCVTGILIAVGYRVLSVEDATEYISKLAVFAVSAFRVLSSVGRISANFNYIIFKVPAVEETYNNIKESNNICNRRVRENIKNNIKDIEFSEAIILENIKFGYEDNKDILNGISLTIKKGSSVAFVGVSGAGKSTLIDILLGLYEPREGIVRMDNMNIFTNPVIWSRKIGYVPQSVYLMDDTIRKNIAFGVEEEKIDDDSVWQALEKAQMKEIVMSLDSQLDTVIGERGLRFSGGQAQRLAIARALYHDPDILFLDEATSALDNDTEKAIMDAIDLLHGNKTIILIAHRLSTVKNCDRIYEIKDGFVCEKKYEDLIKI